MQFRRFSAGLVSYGGDSGQNPNASDNDNPREQQAKEAEIPNVEFTDESFSQDFNSMSSPNYANIERMLLNLALNHTVLIEKE